MTIEEGKKYLDSVLAEILESTPEMNLPTIADRFNNIYGVSKIENDYIYVIVKDLFTKVLIEKFNSIKMNELLQAKLDFKMGFKFITKEDAEKEEKAQVFKNSSLDVKDISARNLRAEFTFDNFVVGESNRFAFISAMKVAESPYSVLNPLYIFGDVGLGKTHLMMAIGHYIYDQNINAKVVYTTAQQFVEDYFVYTKKDNKNIEFFYNKYRLADVLLVDDIQFFENKPGSQEEFFKVFDYLHEKNKQMVITSDRPASELKLMSRLKSRFSWGMPVDIKLPDQALRVNILKRKLESLLSTPSDVPESCLEIIANSFTSNVRELEGALRRFVTYCVSMNIPFNEESVYLSLQGILPDQKSKQSDDVEEKIKNLKKVVTSYFKISEEDLISSSRKPILVYARNLCFYLIRHEMNLQLNTIGEYFGGKDHATITYGISKFKDMLSYDSGAKTDVLNIKDKLNK